MKSEFAYTDKHRKTAFLIYEQCGAYSETARQLASKFPELSGLNFSSLKSWVSDLIKFKRGLGVNKIGAPVACSEKDNLLVSYPQVASEWVEQLNGIPVKDISFRSGKKYWWKCPEGVDHYWYASPHQRTVGGAKKQGSGCPYCSGKRASITNSLQSLMPELAEEWDWELNRGIVIEGRSKHQPIFLTPATITLYSKRKVYWKCLVNKDHKSWLSEVGNRANGNGCPECSKQPSSKTEIRYSFELASIFDHDIDNHKVRVGGALLDCDIVVESHKLVVEYDGSYFHKGIVKRQKDVQKNEFLEKAGWTVVRLREKPLDLIRDYDVSVKAKGNILDETKKLLRSLVEISILSEEQISDYLLRTKPANQDKAEEYIRGSHPLLAQGSQGGRKGVWLDKILEEKDILHWCDCYFAKHKKYPGQGCPSIPEMGDEDWNNIDAALRSGGRGLPACGGLPGFLHEHRNHVHNYNKPSLSIDSIIDWMIVFYQSVEPSRFPSSTDGPVLGAPGEKWSNINASLHNGGRGLSEYSGMSLVKLRGLASERMRQQDSDS